jgi:hypothetical protein
MTNLRQQIEEILCKDCKKDSLVVVAFDCPKCQVHKQTDRICEAIGKSVEGMPLVERAEYFFSFLAQKVALDQRYSDKSYLMGELK